MPFGAEIAGQSGVEGSRSMTVVCGCVCVCVCVCVLRDGVG